MIVVRLTRWVTLALACAALALMPAAASAQVYAPPGKAGSSEYAETIPTSGGNVAPPSDPGSSSGSALGSIGHGSAGAQALSKLGTAGKAAAALARATAPATAAQVPASTRPSGSSTPSGPLSKLIRSPGGSAVGGLASLAEGNDDGGIGFFMPLLLGLSLAGALAVVSLRAWRRGRPAGPRA